MNYNYLESQGFPGNCRESQGFPSIPRVSREVPATPKSLRDSQRFPGSPKDSLEVSGIPKEFSALFALFVFWFKKANTKKRPGNISSDFCLLLLFPFCCGLGKPWKAQKAPGSPERPGKARKPREGQKRPGPSWGSLDLPGPLGQISQMFAALKSLLGEALIFVTFNEEPY